MHIHLPKPLHGWRAFVGEVGIIVLGVLIALGFEQVASGARDRQSAAETRASVRGEIQANLLMMLRRREAEPCIQRRLREVSAFLDLASSAKHPRRPTWIGNPYGPLLLSTRLQSAQSAGKFFLLSAGEQQQLTTFYTDAKDFNDANTREWYDWAQLRSLTDAGAPLGEAEITRVRSALQDARGADWSIRIDISEVVDHARDAGIRAGKVTRPEYQISSVCLPIDTPYAQAAALAGTTSVPFPE